MVSQGPFRGQKFQDEEGRIQYLFWMADPEDEESGPMFILQESEVGDLTALFQLLGAAEAETEVADPDEDETWGDSTTDGALGSEPRG